MVYYLIKMNKQYQNTHTIVKTVAKQLGIEKKWITENINSILY